MAVATKETETNFVPDPGRDPTTTFNKKQRKKFSKGLKEVKRQDNAMWNSLRGIVQLPKILFMLAMVTPDFAQAVGHVAHIVPQGHEARDCNKTMVNELKELLGQ